MHPHSASYSTCGGPNETELTAIVGVELNGSQRVPLLGFRRLELPAVRRAVLGRTARLGSAYAVQRAERFADKTSFTPSVLVYPFLTWLFGVV